MGKCPSLVRPVSREVLIGKMMEMCSERRVQSLESFNKAVWFTILEPNKILFRCPIPINNMAIVSREQGAQKIRLELIFK